jgi:hypothetical protein
MAFLVPLCTLQIRVLSLNQIKDRFGNDASTLIASCLFLRKFKHRLIAPIAIHMAEHRKYDVNFRSQPSNNDLGCSQAVLNRVGNVSNIILR